MGTCTAALKKRHSGVGAAVIVIADLSPSTSYATGGETITLASLNLDTIQTVVIASNTGGYNYQIVHGATDKTAPLLKIYQGDNANAAAAPGIEVPSTTNLSAQVIRVIVHGNYPYV